MKAIGVRSWCGCRLSAVSTYPIRLLFSDNALVAQAVGGGRIQGCECREGQLEDLISPASATHWRRDAPWHKPLPKRRPNTQASHYKSQHGMMGSDFLSNPMPGIYADRCGIFRWILEPDASFKRQSSSTTVLAR
jgi:hypothetical protein